MHLHDIQMARVDDDNSVSIQETHNTAVTMNNMNATYVKLASPLNELSYFHAVENFAQYIMHDILEGVSK